MMKKILLFGLVMLLSVAAIGQNKRVKGNFVGSKYAGKSVFIDTLGYTVVDSSAANIIQIDSVFQGALLQFDTTNGWESVDRAAVLGYKEYVALLTQTGTDAPVATVLYNDLGGAVVWARSNTGVYTATLASGFTVNKTLFGTRAGYTQNIGDDITYYWDATSVNAVTLSIYEVGVAADGMIAGLPFEVRIRVYN